MDVVVQPPPTLSLGNSGLGGDEKGENGDPEVRGDQNPIPTPPNDPTPPPTCGPFPPGQGGPCGLATEEVVVVGGCAAGGGLHGILSTNDYVGLVAEVVGSAARGTPPNELFWLLDFFVRDGRLLTNPALFNLAASVGLLALMPGGSPEIAECAQALLVRAYETELPPFELLVLASLPNEVMVNSLAEEAMHGCKDEHGYLLTFARGLHRARQRDFFGAAKIYSGMLQDEDEWRYPEQYDDAIPFFFIPIEAAAGQPVPMDADELEEALKAVTPPPTV